jgi:hypothetical protein
MPLAITLTLCLGLASCTGSDKAKEADAADAGPKYASPWDKPIAPKGSKAIASTTPSTAPPRNRSLSEMLQLGNADASTAATPSQLEVPDAPLATLEGPAKASEASPGAAGKPTAKDWTIVILGFDKEKEAAAANEALAKVRQQPGLDQAVLEARGKALVVAYGKYPAPDAPAARKDLDRIRALKVGEASPFAGAMMAPPVFEALPGTIPEYDLRNVKKQYGDRGAYTLQVGVYCRMDDQDPSDKEMAEFRAAAERAVVEMRRQGEQAFYYHGPRRSMVTVGLFSDKDYDLKNARVQSPAIASLSRKYPYNLVNGAGVKRKRPGQAEPTMDPSFVVAVP